MGIEPTDQDFTIIDLPVRFTPAEMRDLGFAFARAIRGQPPGNNAFPSEELGTAIDRARWLVKLLSERTKAFGSDLFSDPAWGLLLDLFIAEASPKRISISSACVGSGAPPTTALRHLVNLERKGHVVRTASPEDHRVYYVGLSQDAAETMRRLFTAP